MHYRDVVKRVYFPNDGSGRPRIKRFRYEEPGLVPDTLWLARDVATTEASKKELMEIFSDKDKIGFHAPKPSALIQRIVSIATKPASLVLDSFAGTGPTASAVLAANAKEGGNRKFILVEYEFAPLPWALYRVERPEKSGKVK